MADWTNIPDSNIEPGKPIRSIDGLALRDNPIAIAEGAAGAPKIETAGIAVNERMTTANVLGRTAGASLGAVGTYALLRRTSNVNPGNTVAGSGLVYAGALNAVSADGGSASFDDNPPTNRPILSFSMSAGASTAPAGTWRCMGRIATSSNVGSVAGNRTSSSTGATLWLRIS